jgi:hypothetical protein
MSSQAYTPGLKRKELYLVKKVRRLPIPGKVLVEEGAVVSQETVVALASNPGEPVIVKVASALGVDSEEVERFMLKKVGESVEAGEPLAYYQALFGMIKKSSLSPISGMVERISKITGQVIVRKPPVPIEVLAYVPGTIVEVMPGEGVVVQTPAAFIQGIFGIGGETNGALLVVSDGPGEVLEAERVTSACAGKVVVGGSLVTGAALRKAVEVGVRAIVVGGIRDKDLMEFLGYEIGVAITGQEAVGLTLIITEGFGEMAMSEKTFALLGTCAGKLACVNGATQIRAGVMRPEIIIPMVEVSAAQRVALGEEASFVSEGLRSGTPVRIIREPYFGALGVVRGLPVELQQVQSQSKVRVLVAELEDGRRVVVPRANVEIIEE